LHRFPSKSNPPLSLVRIEASGGRQAAAWPGRVGALFCPGLAGQNNNTRREALLLFF
jgi:hypothetical protein